jgi:uncharacterized DUF497 family protein
MQYEWNENKRLVNLERHGVDFTKAMDFEWDTALETIDDRHDYGEVRWVTIRVICKKLYMMVYTIRGNKIRIISLRKANRRESKYYEKEH